MTRILTCLFCLCTAFATAQQTQPAHFAWGKEQLPANFHLEKGKHHVSDGELVNGKYVRFIQFERTLSERQRTEVDKLGLQFIGYVYPSVYLTLIPQDFELGKLETFDPYSIVALQPAWKMAKTLKEPPYGDWAVSGDWVSINLQVYPNVSMEEKKAWCESNGMELIKIGTQNNLIQVRVLNQELTDIAALPFVQYLELIPPPGQPEDTDGRSLHRSNTIDSDHGAGLKLNGAGVKALVRDDGNLGPHIDFQGRLFNRADRPAEEANHGDGVGGVMGGAGNLDPTKKGMAAGADIYTVDYVNDFQDETLPLHLNEGITITNTSYSDFCNAGYTTTTQTVDQQLFQHPTLMHVFSAGNANGQDCGYGAGAQWGNITGGHKMAKNAIATANLNVDATINTYSSRGPAYDGRLKPDISAYGEGQGSTDIDNTYWAFSGTSAAAPGIAGCLAQLTQAYKVNNGGQNPPSALLKAAILNTANDLGNAGPDFRFGWGHINVWRAYKLLTSQNYIAGAVDNNGTATHQVNVPANLNQVRFMVVWADPPASPLNSKALLNDLDLKVTTPDGATTYLPWKLNPTPNPTALNSAAVQGRDSLNNVEQVTISLPAEGAYQIQLIGTDVPFGPQDYHLVWEFVYDSIKLIYPNGGEGFAPGEVQRIQWDAPGNTENFQLSYSTDGGTTFTPIGNQLSTRRMYNWTVPNTVSGTVYFKVSRGSSEDQNDLPFTIVPLAANLEVSQVCPTSMTVQCTPANDTLSYNAYLLGEKYMDLVGTADSNVVTFPITDPASEKWVSMAATYSNGLLGRRQVAYHWPGQLKNCPQTHDLGVRDLIQPGGDLIVTCNSATQPVVIKLVNEGQNPITGATISYQIDDNPPVTESIPDLQVGESIDYTFQTPITLLGNDTIQLKLWSTYAADVISFNDSVDLVLPYLTSGVTGTFLETFENLEEPPVGWLVHNPDQSITWQLSTELANLVGFDGNNTRAIYMDHFNYSDDAAIDYLYMIPFDLMGVDSPQLTFHLAHRGYSAAFSDGLKVEILPGCDFSATPITLFEKYDPDLATAANQAAFYVPLNLSDWQKVTLDLTAYAGQKALVRFVSLNGYGNSLFIDNIGIQPFEAPPMPPVAAFLNPPDSICRQAPAEFSADQISANATYQWNFGPLSIPGTAVGPGPHSVTFATGGLKNVRLIATNPNGADTAFLQVTVLQFPVSSFTFNSNALTTTFTNGSANADSYLWDFGDGFTSTEVDPVHTYASAGTYTVTLSATNECKTVLKTSDVTVNSAVGLTEITENLSVGVAPNPTESDFWVTIHCKQTEVLQFSLIDAQGRLIKAFDLEIHQGINTIPFEGLDLPKGMYQLNLKTGNGQFSLKVAVQ